MLITVIFIFLTPLLPLSYCFSITLEKFLGTLGGTCPRMLIFYPSWGLLLLLYFLSQSLAPSSADMDAEGRHIKIQNRHWVPPQACWSLHVLDLLSVLCFPAQAHHFCLCQNSGPPLGDRTSLVPGFPVSRLRTLVWNRTRAVGSHKSGSESQLLHFLTEPIGQLFWALSVSSSTKWDNTTYS